MRHMKSIFCVIGLLLSATALSSCSVFGDEPYPRAEQNFFFSARPSFMCDPECGWDMEAEVVAKADSSYGFGEGLTRFVALDLPDHALHLVNVGVSAAELPLDVGQRYRFEADAIFYGLVFPNPTALRVSDDEGLAFYGVSVAALPGTDDSGTGLDEVLLLPDGWGLRFEDTGREAEVGCGTATAYRAIVEHDSSRIRLLQGERGTLGGYDVEVRVSSRMVYDGSCIDGYAHEFSMVIARRAS